MESLETGIPGLDALAFGGLPLRRTTLLTGTPGSGKTVFASQFLAAGVNSFGQPGVMVALEEPAEELLTNMGSFGWDLAGLVDSGQIVMVDATDRGDEWVMGRFDFGGLSARIERAVKEVNAQRLVIDPLDGLFVGFGDPSEVRRALHGMARALRPLAVTTVMTAERAGDHGPLTRFGVEEFVADNLIVLRNALQEERRRRTLEVVKLRGYQHRKGEFPFVIDPITGVEVVPFSAMEQEPKAASERISLGAPELDQMCGGGVSVTRSCWSPGRPAPERRCSPRSSSKPGSTLENECCTCPLRRARRRSCATSAPGEWISRSRCGPSRC
jgi:circadian clock protein KaiC